jgi:hypothetical protein
MFDAFARFSMSAASRASMSISPPSEILSSSALSTDFTLFEVVPVARRRLIRDDREVAPARVPSSLASSSIANGNV